MKNKKIHIALASIIILELILLGVLYLFFQNPCGSPCSIQSLINPFGAGSPKTCIQVCEETQNFWFYPLADLIILTIIIYISFLIISQMKGGHNQKNK